MKTIPLMRSLLLGMLLASGQAAVHAAETAAKPTAARSAAEAAAPKLSRAQIDEWLAKPDKVTFVDLRRPDEHQAVGTLPVYLSIQVADLEKYLAYIPRDRAVIPVSNHAGRAGKAAGILVKAGFNVVGVVGVQNYEEEGGHLSKLQPPPPKADAGAPRPGAGAPPAAKN